MTKSPEEAAREAAEAPPAPLPHTNSNLSSHRNTTSMDSARRRSESQHMYRSTHANSTVQRNENDAMRREERGDDEGHHPEPRTITTTRSPSADRSGGMQGQTLPVVEERGETSSTGERSFKSREEAASRDARPATPPKDRSNPQPPTPAKDYGSPGNGVTRASLMRSSLDKDLPPLPKSEGPWAK